MMINQLRRMFYDDGSGDKDFSNQEARLREAQAYLKESAEGLTKAADILSELIRVKMERDARAAELRERRSRH